MKYPKLSAVQVVLVIPEKYKVLRIKEKIGACFTEKN